MLITCKDDWIKEAQEVAPLLPEYMSEFGSVNSQWLEDKFAELIGSEDWRSLHRQFEDIWSWLPDSPSIRKYPFGRLCDLCSEAWAIYDDGEEH